MSASSFSPPTFEVAIRSRGAALSFLQAIARTMLMKELTTLLRGNVKEQETTRGLVTRSCSGRVLYWCRGERHDEYQVE